MFNYLRRLARLDILRGASYMLVASIMVNITRVLLVVLLSRYYSKEEFGVWATITSTAAVIATGDFGIINALRNKLSFLNAKEGDGIEQSKQYFYSSFIFLFLITGVIISLIFIFKEFIPFDYFFKTDNLLLKEKGAEIFFYIQILFLINIPLSIGLPLFFSYQETFISALFTVIQAFFSFIIVLGLVFNGQDIVVISLMYFICNLLVSAVGTLYFIYKRKWYSYRFILHDFLLEIKELFPIGIKFMFLQIGSSLMQNAGTICLGASIGVSTAAEFNIAQKLYSFFTGIYQSIFNPMWGAYANAIAHKNIDWCKKMLNKSSLFTVLAFTCFIIFVILFGNQLICILAGSQYQTDYMLLLILGLISMFYILFTNVSLLQNATNRINLLIFINYGGVFILIPFINNYASFLGINGVSSLLVMFWIVGFFIVYCQSYNILNSYQNENN